MKVLDCSLRDGGFLNGWNFSVATMDRLVDAIASTPVDFIELGYLDDHPDLPEANSLPSSTLHRYRTHAPKLAGMIRPSCPNWKSVLERRSGLLHLVRVTVQVNDPSPSFEIAATAKNMGFQVTLNLTNVSAFPLEKLAEVVAQAPSVDAIYLADSRGHLQPKDIAPMVAAVRSGWPGAIGFHPHDNRSWAKENAQEALAAGCTWIDGSVAGMGLGGRNLRLEDALELSGRTPRSQWMKTRETDWDLPECQVPKEIYRLAGAANWPQAWADEFVAEQGAAHVLASLRDMPNKPWSVKSSVVPWMGDARNRCPFERMRIYQSQTADHESASRVFHQLVRPVHENHGAVFLSRDVLPSGETVVRWLYPSEKALIDIQKAVAEDPQTIKHREERMRFGLHGMSFTEYRLKRS